MLIRHATLRHPDETAPTLIWVYEGETDRACGAAERLENACSTH